MATTLYAQWSKKGIESVLDLDRFDALRPRARQWTGRRLVLTGLWQGCLGERTLGERFACSHDCLRRIWPTQKLGKTYTGWIDALVDQGPILLAELKCQLRRQILHAVPEAAPLVLAWVADGTLRSCPRSPANERAFGCNGKPNGPPQLLTTGLIHLGSRQWWNWVSGPSDADEKAQLERMLPTLPPGAILVVDAGFATEPMLRRILAGCLHVVVRACGNVRLIAPQPADAPDRELWFWPQRVQRQGLGPLRLRRVVLGQGASLIHVLTDLPADQFSAAEVGALFASRWQIELDWRDLKGTLNLRTLRSRSPDRALCEADWDIAALAVLGAMTARQLRRRHVAPQRMSVAKARRAVRAVLEHPERTSRDNPLPGPLGQAVQDRYVRPGPKQTRPPVRKKRRRHPGPPKLRLATPQELERAATLARASPAG